MNSENLIRVIEKEYAKTQDIYFSYAWRERVEETLKEESKYARLVEWINERVNLNKTIIDMFNPADRNEQYNNGFFSNYRKACEELAMLINMKCIILDNRCSSKMRENIEYAICKIFGIHYSQELGYYL